jgi:uncharacterized protein YjbI with pentapeptide repeats
VANLEQLAELDKGVDSWNHWRLTHLDTLIDLRGAQLDQVALRGVDLTGANLRGCSLRNANLRGADLIGTILEMADLREANLSESNLRRANLTKANLTGASLSKTSLSQAQLAYAQMARAYLGNCDLTASNLTGAHLSDCILTEARMSESILIKAELDNAEMASANLSKADLSGASLSMANLQLANFNNAILTGTDLRLANLVEANLCEARLHGVNLTGANLYKAQMRSAQAELTNLSEGNLRQADLGRSIFVSCDLREACLFDANLSDATIRSSHIERADLRRAALWGVDLDGSTLTDSKLWESQRSGWSIKEIICESVYWDERAITPTLYSLNEFERLYSSQVLIDLFYDGGISSFELSMLPVLLHRLASRHPNADVRLKTIEEAGGGARITISLGDATPQVAEDVRIDAERAHRSQLALRGQDVELIELRAALQATERAYDRLLDKIGEPATQVINIFGNHQGPLQLGNQAAMDSCGNVTSDHGALIQILDQLLVNLAIPSSSLKGRQRISETAETTRNELQKPSPDKSILKRGWEFFKALPREAVLKGAGKVGERIADADWSNFLDQLKHIIHHAA